jgi:diacylglycerol O-acyltransferase / wax synthase
MVDGVGSIDVAHLLLDASPEPTPRAAAESAVPDGHDGSILRIPGALLHGARAGVGALMHPKEASQRGKSLVELLVRNEVLAAPHSSLNQPLGKYRRYTYVEAPLKDLKAIKRELGGTVNDVALAATTAGLRALLVHRGEQPPESGLRAMVPVNVRSAADQMALGNRISSLFVHLPVAEKNPLVRYAKVLDDAERLKAGDQAAASSTLVELAGAAPPVLHSTVAQSLFATRLFNVTVTNVPGPQLTLYSFGSPMRQVLGLVPLAAAHDVGVAILSYDGNVTFGIVADRDSVPDIAVAAAGIEDSLGELLAIAKTRRTTRDRRASRDRRQPARR